MNVEKYKADLEKLIELGGKLLLSMKYECDPDGFKKQVKKQLGDEAAKKFCEKLPSFNKKYEAWYSEALALLKQLLSHRVENFVSLYEIRKGRKQLTYENYSIQDYLRNTVVRNYADTITVPRSSAISNFEQQLNIVIAAQQRFESSLFEIQQLVQADLFDSELDAARELLKHKFLRSAGAIAGVLIEKHLKQVCIDHNIKITKKNPTIGDLNDLLKSNNVIEQHQWREISFLADRSDRRSIKWDK